MSLRATGKVAFATNLPAQVTSFIGRDHEIAEVMRLLAETRLLTLTGAGGCGKTRLALQVAGALLADYRDGVWVVELASLPEPALVPNAVAFALGVSQQRAQSMSATLLSILRSKSLLLVLDNCDHVLPACAELVEVLLRGCPGLRVLATSREALGIGGETRWLVPSLSLPAARHVPPLKELIAYEAVRLFYDRAKAVSPAFVITEANAPAVVRVCRRLDGIPLAIELAVARLKVLAVEQIAERLDDRFRLLTGRGPVSVPRHQTLRAAMDWSYDLLTEKERTVLRRLSVFSGGYTLEAAEAVCSRPGVDASELLDVLTGLVDKSIVMCEAREGEARYRLLETIRQYGWEKLAESGETADVRQRHFDWYLVLVERAWPEQWTAKRIAWLNRLETEHDNLRAALEWSKTAVGTAEAGLRLAGSLYEFWYTRGYWSEGRGWLEGALARSSEAPVSALPLALRGAAHLARCQGDYARATELCEKGLALCQELGDKENFAVLSLNLGLVKLHQGDYEHATTLLQDCLTLCREQGNHWHTGAALACLGGVARVQGDYGRAVTLYSEALALGRELGDGWLIAYALRNLGRVKLHEGDFPRAEAHYAESLALSMDVGGKWMVYEGLEGLARIACSRGHHSKAGLLFGTTEALREALGLHVPKPELAVHAQSVAVTRAELGETAFAALLAEGRDMMLEQAVEYALAPADAVPHKAKATRGKAAREQAVLLTHREREIATLVARGLTNRAIASQLVISLRTADGHVQHILNKLGFDSRAQIAAWAVEHGLQTSSSHS